jgi:DNA-binding CsgD family transcriptional regulator
MTAPVLPTGPVSRATPVSEAIPVSALEAGQEPIRNGSWRTANPPGAHSAGSGSVRSATSVPKNSAGGVRAVSTQAGLDAALATARREVLVARTDVHEPLRRVDHENLARGVGYRVLVPDDVRSRPGLVLRLGTLAGAVVRTLPAVPADATVVDASLALLPDFDPAGLALVRVPGVVTAVGALFEQLWASASPLARPLGLRERELLSLLAAGCTDESAAARLGISVRTVRRMMSTIMSSLGARSRFQAGLRAADRGLLSSP